MVAIFAASSLPDVPDLPAGLGGGTGHFIGYALLSALAFRAFARAEWRGLTPRAAWQAFALACFYGITDEYHQSFVRNRYPSVEDWLVDALGAAFGIAMVLMVRRVRASRAR
jgi:VanZ family protein